MKKMHFNLSNGRQIYSKRIPFGFTEQNANCLHVFDQTNFFAFMFFAVDFNVLKD